MGKLIDYNQKYNKSFWQYLDIIQYGRQQSENTTQRVRD